MRKSKHSITVFNKIQKNTTKYNLDRQTAKISALSSRNIGKYEFLTGEDVLPEKVQLEKAAIVKRFEYSLLDSELKSKLVLQKNNIKDQTECANFMEQQMKVIKKPTLNKYDKSDLKYVATHIFNKYRDIKKII